MYTSILLYSAIMHIYIYISAYLIRLCIKRFSIASQAPFATPNSRVPPWRPPTSSMIGTTSIAIQLASKVQAKRNNYRT